MSMGIEIAAELKERYPAQFDVTKLLLLTGNAETMIELQQGVAAREIIQGWTRDLADFEKVRVKYLLYK